MVQCVECQTCGRLTSQPIECPRCHAINYCSQVHRQAHWRADHHDECHRMQQHILRCQELRDLPFEFIKQTADMVDSGQSTACQFLAQRQLHLQDLWKAECSCCDKRWGENAMSLIVEPVQCSNQGSSPSAFKSWKDYYMFQRWSLSDPRAIILDAPMTLLWALQQLPIWLPVSSSKNHHDVIVHYLGAQKELDQWPVFLELMHVMPCTSLQISFISPDVPSNLDGKRKIFTKQQGSIVLSDAVQAACTSSECEAVLASDAAMQDSSHYCSHGGQKQFSCEFDSPRDDTNGMHPVVWSAESQCPAAKDAAQLAQPASSAESISQTLQLSFQTGCYHDVATDIQQEFGRPDLVFGANAGVLARPERAGVQAHAQLHDTCAL
ncbi:TPA: hypothetical protein ACH3X2_004458 [Trebouxia sp. C0005]